MNKKGQANVEEIVGSIIALLFMIIFISAMIPVFQSLTGQDEKQGEINSLNARVAELEGELANRNREVSELSSFLTSLNSTIEEKDGIISNLTGELTEKEEKIKTLSQELENYIERAYLSTINNNYYNILNYVEKIENKFYTLNLAISLISLTLFGIVIRLFKLDVAIKLAYRRYKKSRKKESAYEEKEE